MLKRFITFAGSILLVWSASAGELSGVAPDFDLAARDGGRVALSDLSGQVVMVNFWATWCGPCRAEMPHLEALYHRYSDLGFTLLGVNVEEDSSGADRFLEATPVSFPILFDPENNVSELYDVVAMPSTVLIDKSGNMRYIHHGYQPGYENEYQSQIRALIRE
ncbi:MAG TPA: TlpA disulfide reductase family protein [Gammaproteobacteria bacterium]|nr:TlpA disulfide reductase family protein [Gammaproteobacteria bacterium]